MWLPVAVASAAQWTLHDFAQRALTSDPAAAGVCQVDLGPVPQDELWLVDRMVVSCDSAVETAAGIYLDVVDPGRAIDGTWFGNFDVADLASAIQLPGTTSLICQWTACEAGDVGTLRIQYQIMRKPAE